MMETNKNLQKFTDYDITAVLFFMNIYTIGGLIIVLTTITAEKNVS